MGTLVLLTNVVESESDEVRIEREAGEAQTKLAEITEYVKELCIAYGVTCEHRGWESRICDFHFRPFGGALEVVRAVRRKYGDDGLGFSSGVVEFYYLDTGHLMTVVWSGTKKEVDLSEGNVPCIFTISAIQELRP